MMFVLSSCAMLPYPGADAKGRLVHGLYIKIAILALIVLVGVLGTMIVELIAFRKRAGDEQEPVQDHGKPSIYIGFFAVGLILVAILFPTAEVTLHKVDEVAKNPDLHLTITGSQWQWSASYMKDGFTVSGQSFKKPMTWELPIGKTVKIDLKSNDVMHDFYMPQFNYDLNATPGITNTFSFTPDRLGTFPGQCAQLCGRGHYQMKFILKVVTNSQFAKWTQLEKSEAHAKNCAPPSKHITMIAHNIAWNTKCIGAPAGQPFTVTMKNEDKGITHNFSIYTSANLKTSLFKGPLFKGPATKVLHVPALKAGTYYFQCDVHGQAMSGTLIVGPKENEAPATQGTDFKVVAKNIQFNTSRIVVPAGKEVTITMENEDQGITHNFAIYQTPQASKNLFRGPLFKGPGVKVLHVPALQAGSYYFQCDVHGKAMSGTYVVTG